MSHNLTTRQLDVLRLMCAGESTNQIAITLHISVNTVETHRKNLFRKLGIKNVASAVKYGLENHII